jgi:hypothetical protein
LRYGQGGSFWLTFNDGLRVHALCHSQSGEIQLNLAQSPSTHSDAAISSDSAGHHAADDQPSSSESVTDPQSSLPVANNDLDHVNHSEAASARSVTGQVHDGQQPQLSSLTNCAAPDPSDQSQTSVTFVTGQFEANEQSHLGNPAASGHVISMMLT